VAFGDFIYDEMDRDRYFLLIYDIYFDDDYDVNYSINTDSNMNEDVFINKLEVEFKENIKGAQQKKIIGLVYIDHFNYKFTIVIKVYLFKDHIDTTNINEASLRFAIHYSKIQ
jgi:hypothetical protein